MTDDRRLANRIILGLVVGALLVVQLIFVKDWVLDTKDMEAMKDTGMVGYVPHGSTLTSYDEVQSNDDPIWHKTQGRDEVRWTVTPASSHLAVQALERMDRAAARAGFTVVVTPLGEHEIPWGDPGEKVYSFERHRPGDDEISISAFRTKGGTVDAQMQLVP